MFGGLVETIGKVLRLEERAGCITFTIGTNDYTDWIVGESIAVNGVCLTITHFNAHSFQVTAVPETLRLSNLKRLQVSDVVNLERALKVNSRLGGHYLQGHIDAEAQVLEVTDDQGEARLVTISLSPSLGKYVVKKGFIAIDGMSMTIVDVTSNTFTLTIIPHTQAVTIAAYYKKGSYLNLEVDMVAKYIEKLLETYKDARNFNPC